MTDPLSVEIWRGNQVETRHRGTVAVVDPDGRIVMSFGDVSAPVFPRSACKAMQALPLVEGGAADALGFGNREIALASSSHSGEPEHVTLAGAMLKAAGLAEADLECGIHWSSDQTTLIGQVRTLERPSALHNNCSGKHAGFLCACRHSGKDTRGYVKYDHPLQGQIRDVMHQLTGTKPDRDNAGIDGCAIPTYALPLTGLAHGFARMATGAGLDAQRAKASRRIIDACMAEPFFVSGTRRTCARLMQAAPGRIFAKTGAEGVFCAAIPEKGIGIALKCHDGATRAADAMIAAVLSRFFDGEVRATLQALSSYDLSNWNGDRVGKVDVYGLPA